MSKKWWIIIIIVLIFWIWTLIYLQYKGMLTKKYNYECDEWYYMQCLVMLSDKNWNNCKCVKIHSF